VFFWAECCDIISAIEGVSKNICLRYIRRVSSIYKENIVVVDVLKITSAVDVKNSIQNAPKQQPLDAIFDLNNPNAIPKDAVKGKQLEDDSTKQALLKNLNREIYKPLLNQTKAQADSIRKLVLYAKLFEVSSGVITEDFLTQFFVLPKELLGELLKREQSASIYKGDFFEALRILSKNKGEPKLQEAIISILKHFDSYVNRDHSLQAVLIRSRSLLDLLVMSDRQILQNQIAKLKGMLDGAKLQAMMLGESVSDGEQVSAGKPNAGQGTADGAEAEQPGGTASTAEQPDGSKPGAPRLNMARIAAEEESYKEIIKFLKNEFVPILRAITANYSPVDKVYDHMISIIHYIVRYDKADLKMLEEAFDQFAEELRPLFPNLSEDDISDMKETLMRTAREIKEQTEQLGALKDREGGLVKTEEGKYVYIKEESDMAALLTKALDKSSPAKLSASAQNLLLYIIQSESPMLPMMHFMIPLRVFDENTYVEFFVDKDCKERKGDAKQATNIFFTIQSDLYGTFEVDLLARDLSIDLDIKCPHELIDGVKGAKQKFRNLIEAQGYRLTAYQVGEYTASKTILKQFPKLRERKAGIDVKI